MIGLNWLLNDLNLLSPIKNKDQMLEFFQFSEEIEYLLNLTAFVCYLPCYLWELQNPWGSRTRRGQYPQFPTTPLFSWCPPRGPWRLSLVLVLIRVTKSNLKSWDLESWMNSSLHSKISLWTSWACWHLL